MIRNCRLLRRNLFELNLIQKCRYGFEQDKTLVELVSQNQEVRYIKSISNFGFRLNNGMFTIGPIVIFNEILLSWNIKDVQEINPHSLSLFRMFVPKFEVLIIGVGDNLRNLHPDLIPYLTRNKVAYEIQNTKDAAKLYNMMVMDKRNIAACLFPQMSIGAPEQPKKDDYLRLFEAKTQSDLVNSYNLDRIFHKHYDTYRIYLQEQHFSKEELKRKIAAENEASRYKRPTFAQIIEEEIKVIKEEEQKLLEDEDNTKKKSIFDEKPSIDPNRKLIK